MLIGMTTSSSRGSHGKAPAVDGKTDWRRNRCFLPPWHEQPKCTCQRQCIIDVWEFMALNGLGDVTSSVPIRTQTLWYGGNLYDLFKIYTFMSIH
jgi:hypothetical protein